MLFYRDGKDVFYIHSRVLDNVLRKIAYHATCQLPDARPNVNQPG